MSGNSAGAVSNLIPPMNTDVLTPPAAAVNPTAVLKKNFRVTVITDPSVLAQSPSKYVSILLGANMSPNASAVLSNFAFSGGSVTKQFMNHGTTGHFSSVIKMQCRPQSPAPQVIGLLSATLTQFSFNVAIDTACSINDWFTLSFCDEQGMWFPTTAEGHPGLIASVSWNTGGQFASAGYQGNGEIDGQSDAGFSATVVAL